MIGVHEAAIPGCTRCFWKELEVLRWVNRDLLFKCFFLKSIGWAGILFWSRRWVGWELKLL